jgi:hypothetical protein
VATAFKPTFRRLDGTIGASGATDHDALLEASELMPVGTEQVFEKAHSISAHELLFRPAAAEGFDLAQPGTYFFASQMRRRFPPPWSVEELDACFRLHLLRLAAAFH